MGDEIAAKVITAFLDESEAAGGEEVDAFGEDVIAFWEAGMYSCGDVDEAGDMVESHWAPGWSQISWIRLWPRWLCHAVLDM